MARSPGTVVYANREAERLLGYAPGALVGWSAWETAIRAHWARVEAAFRALFEAERPQRVVIGLDYAHYARRDDESAFRAVLTVEPFQGPEGPMACVMIREFLSDVETLLREIRLGDRR